MKRSYEAPDYDVVDPDTGMSDRQLDAFIAQARTEPSYWDDPDPEDRPVPTPVPLQLLRAIERAEAVENPCDDADDDTVTVSEAGTVQRQRRRKRSRSLLLPDPDVVEDDEMHPGGPFNPDGVGLIVMREDTYTPDLVTVFGMNRGLLPRRPAGRRIPGEMSGVKELEY